MTEIKPTPPGKSAGVISTGIEGLDYILGGGLTPRRLYLIEGTPGVGKTTLAMRFLIEGARVGERALYVSLSETESELRAISASHGWSLDGVNIRELIPSEESLRPDQQYTLFHPSEVELGETTLQILAEAERVRPNRVVFDSVSEMRLLAGNPLRYRRQILALKQFFLTRGCTVLILDDRHEHERDLQLQTLAHGVITLEQHHPEFGRERRRIRVLKFRGVRFRGGHHDLVIETGGLKVFPRLVAAEHRHLSSREKISSGVPGLDALLGGGLQRGTSSLITGSPGTGKSSLALQFAATAAARGESAALFLFDESVDTLLSRAEGLNIDIRDHVKSGRIVIQPVDPAELTPGQFTDIVMRAVQRPESSLIVIDSLNGYLNAMPEERFLTIHLHELLAFLGHMGVATLLVGVHQGFIGGEMSSPADASYLADAVILLRYFELRGEVRQAISIVKNRASRHERTIREFRLDGGIQVGEPLTNFRGVLTGVPVYDGGADSLTSES
jgi:circadian clock protein KaiC